MGVDSGLPDFRGNEGFWRAYPVLAEAGLDFTRIASPDAFERDPSLAWGFYGHRLDLYRKTTPHEGFSILKRWGARMPDGCRVFTSNVDGHFQKAGFAGDVVHECHGSIHHLQCTRCNAAPWSASCFEPVVDAQSCRLLSALPRCPSCGAIARPNVLMFSDWGWDSVRSDATREAQAGWISGLTRSRRRVVIVEVGAGTDIATVRQFDHYVQNVCGARLVRINPRESEVKRRWDIGIPSGGLSALRAIDAILSGTTPGDEAS